MSNIPMGVLSKVTQVVALSLVHNSSSDADSPGVTHTFTSVGFGAAASDRQIVVTIDGTNTLGGDIISSMVIGGVSATKVMGVTTTAGEIRQEIWYAAVPTGTSGTVTATWNSAVSRNYIGVYRMTGAATGATATASDVSGTGNLTGSLTIPANGGAVALATAQGGPTCTWTNITERFEVKPASSNENKCGAMDNFEAAQSPLAITATLTSYPANEIMVCAAWGPG